jgi:hypothetical protein
LRQKCLWFSTHYSVVGKARTKRRLNNIDVKEDQT